MGSPRSTVARTMTTTSHPFGHDRVVAVANEHGTDEERLDEALADVQRALERTDGGYEYSSEHNYGWHDDDAYYLYGDGIWETLRTELSASEDVIIAAREVHYRAMSDAARERGEQSAVEEMLADGNALLVVTNTAEGPPRFGQDV